MRVVLVYMCGIVGYVGNKDAAPILLRGLEQLEYRGYDSAGLVCVGTRVAHYRAVGKVQALKEKIAKGNAEGTRGIAHTRWATHGEPKEENAHPHTDCTNRFFVVHNGIIENYRELKKELQSEHHIFSSDTDTEVVAHLIESYIAQGHSVQEAFVGTLSRLRGAYGLLVLDSENPDTLYASRVGSPLVFGIKDNEVYIASDPSVISPYTKSVVYLDDGDIAIASPSTFMLLSKAGERIEVKETFIEPTQEASSKGEYEHFMLKEIMEGADVIKNTTAGRIADDGDVQLGGVRDVREKLLACKRLYILACGTSYYAALVGEYLLEELAHIPTEVCIASEFRYRGMPLESDACVIAVSQSGETADTLAALIKAKEAGLLTLGIVNVPGSSIARETDAGIYNHAGKEVGVASTKAYLSQVTVFLLLAAYIHPSKENKGIIKELKSIPHAILKLLQQRQIVQSIAEKYKDATGMLYVGRRLMHPTALEGALKLKEITYIHAEGYSAGEMKHGPLALIDENFPTVALVLQNSTYDKMSSNIQEIKARKGRILAIATEGDLAIVDSADDVLYVPKTNEYLEPLLSVVPLQLFAYYVGIAKGYDVDKPRNLAKSVTVE